MHTVDDSVQYIGSREKQMGKRNTGCYWYKVSEFKSLESSDSVQHDKGPGGPGQPESRRKCVAGTVAHQSILIAFHLSLSLTESFHGQETIGSSEDGRRHNDVVVWTSFETRVTRTSFG